MWSQECNRVFEELKERLSTAPVLVYPDFERGFVLETDASVHGIGAVLSQRKEDQRLHPIAYASRALSPAEQCYGITELETLAVVWSISHFHHYLYGNSVTVFTDHTAVKAVLETANPTAKHARWWTRVYGRGVRSVKIVYRPGRENTNADALSRHPLLPAPVVGVAEDEVQVSRVSAYRGDVDYREVPAQLPVSVLMADSRSHPLNSSVQEGGTHVEPLMPDSLGMEKETETVTPLPCAEERATAATEDFVPVTTPTNVMTIPVSGSKASGDSPSLVGDDHSDPRTDIGTLLLVDPGSSPSSTPNVPGDFAVEQKKSRRSQSISRVAECRRTSIELTDSCLRGHCSQLSMVYYTSWTQSAEIGRELWYRSNCAVGFWRKHTRVGSQATSQGSGYMPLCCCTGGGEVCLRIQSTLPDRVQNVQWQWERAGGASHHSSRYLCPAPSKF